MKLYKMILSMALLSWTIVAPVYGEQSDSKKRVVLNSPRVDISYEDVERYIVENLPEGEAERTAVLNRPGIYQEMAESLYVMRSLALEAEASPNFDEEQAKWAAQMAYHRKLVQQYRVSYVRETLKNADWKALAKEKYQATPENFMRTETISASHILIKTDERSDEEALALSTTLYERLKKGESFDALAKEYSEDGASRRGGNLGFFKRGKMTKLFEDAAFALEKKGDITGPVKTSFGYHIIALDDRRPEGLIPFAEVKTKIIRDIQTSMGSQVWQDKILALRSSKELKLNESMVRELREIYGTSFESLEE